jgi:hypothetical protein
MTPRPGLDLDLDLDFDFDFGPRRAAARPPGVGPKGKDGGVGETSENLGCQGKVVRGFPHRRLAACLPWLC